MSARQPLVILGHPDSQGFCGALANAYVTGAQNAGLTAELLALGEMTFNPVLKAGYKEVMLLEPDLQMAQEKIMAADHLVWVFPIWWGSVPALMKGFIDRTFLPGYAFRFRESGVIHDGLLKGKSARLIATTDAPPLVYRYYYGEPGIKMMKNLVLDFCGVKPVKSTVFGPLKFSSLRQRQQWLAKAEALGRAGE